MLHSHCPGVVVVFPAGQNAHALSPGPSVNFPFGHTSHRVSPGAGVYRPHPQSRHSDVIAWDALPAGHTKLRPSTPAEVPGAAQEEPTGGRSHDLEPGLSAHVPVAHFSHSLAPAFPENLPGAQGSCSAAPGPLAALPVSASTHASSPTAPSRPRNLPLGHFPPPFPAVHLPLNPALPAGQSSHVPGCDPSGFAPTQSVGVLPSGHVHLRHASALDGSFSEAP